MLFRKEVYYTESDIEGYESQIETLKSRVSEYANELNMRDVRLKNMAEQHQGEVAILKAKISSNAGNYNPQTKTKTKQINQSYQLTKTSLVQTWFFVNFGERLFLL